jgi:hypothetical protein
MASTFDAAELLAVLRTLLSKMPKEEPDVAAVPRATLRSLRTALKESIERLQALSNDLGEFRLPPLVFDPANPHVVGQLIGDTLLEQPRVPLKGGVGRFYGSGVYALYYRGPFAAYAPISRSDTPIYVGKADPADRYALTVQDQGDRLSRRLGDHERSLNAVQNLKTDDFDCRYLVVKTAWEGTAEDYLINLFKPVWNNEMNVCKGFGKHGDDASTRSNTRSPWDTLHPGRPWATREGNVPNPRGAEQIMRDIAKHFETHKPVYREKKF